MALSLALLTQLPDVPSKGSLADSAVLTGLLVFRASVMGNRFSQGGSQMAAFLTLAVWFAALGVAWWMWASIVEYSEPAGPVINVVFILLGMFLVWFILFGNVPSFMHFGPHHPHGFLAF